MEQIKADFGRFADIRVLIITLKKGHFSNPNRANIKLYKTGSCNSNKIMSCWQNRQSLGQSSSS